MRPDPDWVRTTLIPVGTWHYYPVTQVLLLGLAVLTGWNPAFHHGLSLLLHAGVGVGLLLWLRRMGVDPRAAVIAPLIFVSRGVTFEAVTWISTTSYLIVSALALLTLASWDRALRGGGRGATLATVAGFAAAVLTIEHAFVLLPLYALYDVILGRERSLAFRLPRRAEPARAWLAHQGAVVLSGVRRYLPFVLVIVAFLAFKLAFGRSLLVSASVPESAPAPIPSGMDFTAALPADRRWLGILNTPLRAYRDLLVGASYLFLPVSICTGAEDSLLTRLAPWVLLPWLAAHLWALWRGSPLVRFLIAWVYVYLLPLSFAGVPQARYYYMAAVPASALIALALLGAWNALDRRLPARLGALLIGAGVALMIVQEAAFVRARLGEWGQASQLLRTLVGELQRDLEPDTREVVMLNLPRAVPGPSWPAWTFATAAEYLPLMVRPPRHDVVASPVYDRTFVGDRWATIGRYAAPDEVRRRIGRPGTIGYRFLGHSPWFERLR